MPTSEQHQPDMAELWALMCEQCQRIEQLEAQVRSRRRIRRAVLAAMTVAAGVLLR